MVSGVFYDLRGVLMKQSTKDFVTESDLPSLAPFVDYLLSDLFYKETGLKENQYQIVVKEYEIFEHELIKKKE